MADPESDRLETFRQFAAVIDDPRQLELLAAMLEVFAQDTRQVLDQVNIARDIAVRTLAGDWFASTELREVRDDAEYLLKQYKDQRGEIEQLRAAVQARLARPESNPG